jgi:hypothetical protein
LPLFWREKPFRVFHVDERDALFVCNLKYYPSKGGIIEWVLAAGRNGGSTTEAKRAERHHNNDDLQQQLAHDPYCSSTDRGGGKPRVGNIRPFSKHDSVTGITE